MQRKMKRRIGEASMVSGGLCRMAWLALSTLVTCTYTLPVTSSSTKASPATAADRPNMSPYLLQSPPQHKTSDADMAATVLSKYGYFRKGRPLNLQMAQIGTEEVRPERHSDSDAIRVFQSYFGLQQTGQLDKPTMELMTKKRCGVADIPEESDSYGNNSSQSPSSFQLLGSKWEHTRLTWRLQTPTSQLHQSQQRRVMTEAFNTWRNVAPLEFRETSADKVDINIQFGAKNHGDSYPFDGRGLVLAHAFGPGIYDLAGDMHVDDDEKWSVEEEEGTSDLLLVAIHELGHSLGLAHSRDPDAIMYPYYGLTNTLGQDDIKAIQSLYGARIGQPISTPTPRTRRPPSTPAPTRAPATRSLFTKSTTTQTTPPQGCVLQFDTVIQDDPSNRVYSGILGNQIYRFKDSGLLPGYPSSLISVYPGAPVNAEAVFTVPESYSTYFIKGNQVWRYQQQQLAQDYPKTLEPTHFPETIRFVLPLVDNAGNRRIFVFGRTLWVEYNFDVLPSYRPRPHVIPQYWPAVSSDVMYAVMGTDNYLYFISSDSHVMLDTFRRAVNGGKQKGHPEWMQPGCPLTAAMNSGESRLQTFRWIWAVSVFLCLLGLLSKC